MGSLTTCRKCERMMPYPVEKCPNCQEVNYHLRSNRNWLIGFVLYLLIMMNLFSIWSYFTE